MFTKSFFGDSMSKANFPLEFLTLWMPSSYVSINTCVREFMNCHILLYNELCDFCGKTIKGNCTMLIYMTCYSSFVLPRDWDWRYRDAYKVLKARYVVIYCTNFFFFLNIRSSEIRNDINDVSIIAKANEKALKYYCNSIICVSAVLNKKANTFITSLNYRTSEYAAHKKITV